MLARETRNQDPNHFDCSSSQINILDHLLFQERNQPLLCTKGIFTLASTTNTSLEPVSINSVTLPRSYPLVVTTVQTNEVTPVELTFGQRRQQIGGDANLDVGQCQGILAHIDTIEFADQTLVMTLPG